MDRALRATVLREIDLTRTRAFSLEATDVCGTIFINRSYARDRGLDEQTFIHETSAEIMRGLQQTAGKLGVKIETFSSKDLYTGEFAELAPELLLRVNDSAISVSRSFGREIFENRLINPQKTGTHRQEGVFLLSGAQANSGQLSSPLNILDVAPTFYHLLGLPVPRDLDGKVALDAFASQYRRVSWSSGADISSPPDRPGPPAPEEFADLNNRLRDLGYLD
jgi:predicted AlkP superfamily phosphohydrolase/phosphomutase